MSTGLALDGQWIKNTMDDVESSASTVVTVETSDPMRVTQLHAQMAGRYKGQVYQFHPWTGLGKFDMSKECYVPVTSSAGTDYDSSLQSEYKELGGALRFMDRILQQQTVAFILQGLDCSTDNTPKNHDLINALRAWVLNKNIMKTKSVICLVTANPANAIDQSTLDLTTLVRPELASEAERLELVRRFIGRQSRFAMDEENQRSLALGLRGLNLHQVDVVLRKTYFIGNNLNLETAKHYKSDYIRRSEVLEIEEPETSFADIGGYEAVKRMVKKTLIKALQRRQRAELAALPLPRGLLLYGPPGTGKTLFAKSLARETNLPFINLKTENLFSQWLGVTGQRLRDAIDLAEQASPSIVFVDEIDRFGQRSSGGADGASQETQRVFSQLLEWLGDPKRKAIIVGTTNVPESLDKAFIRPGRFSYCIPFLYPDVVAREQILRLHLGFEGSRPKPAMDETDVCRVLPQLAKETEFYTGADLEELVTRAKQNFFDEGDDIARMSANHVMAAHNDYRINIEDRKSTINRYKTLGSAFANSLSLLDEEESN